MVAGIGCTYCAWCFDEALVARDLTRQVVASEAQPEDEGGFLKVLP